MADNSCINWTVDLARATAAGDNRLAFRSEDSILTAADLWFWRDNDRRPIVVEMLVPAGMEISTPWAEFANDVHTNETGVARFGFRPDATAATRSSRIAIGRFKVQTIHSGGAQIKLAAIGKLSSRQRTKIGAWISQTADSLTSVYNRFPQQRTQVLVVPIGNRKDAVPWAHVLRGGGIGIEFFIDENRALDEYTSDWTATHEFSHLLLPYVTGRDRWLSEGLASYYQNVLRARDGRLSEQQAWQKLHEGFERARNGSYQGSLARASRAGYGATMRIYWSGAAMMLKADAELRRLSSGRQSLDSALARLNTCCLQNDKRWRARDLLEQLDTLTGTTVFSELYNEHIKNDKRFPDVSETFAQLGVNTREPRVKLEPKAPWSRIRYYIMNG